MSGHGGPRRRRRRRRTRCCSTWWACIPPRWSTTRATRRALSELFNVAQPVGVRPAVLPDPGGTRPGCRRDGAGPPARIPGPGRAGHPPAPLPHAASQLGTVIDDRPLSETSPVRAYTSDGRNYISWLIDAAKTSLDAVVAEQGFTGDVSPQALLYLYLRHALMLGYYDTRLRAVPQLRRPRTRRSSPR